MSMLQQYRDFENRLRAAIKYTALPSMVVYLSDEIEKKAAENVYSYPANPKAMASRRYMLGDKSNLEVTISDMELEIRNVTVMQSGEPDEVKWVEEGINQGDAGARPFMDEALQEYINSGNAELDLRTALQSQGFEVWAW